MAEPDIGSRDLILVTGASGFLGAAIANTARLAGYRVRVLVRPSSPRTNIHGHDQVVVGDFRDRESMSAALHGLPYLVHAAPAYRLSPPSPHHILHNTLNG